MMQVETLTPEDVDFVVAHLWARGQDEAKRYSIYSLDELRRHILRSSKEYGFTMRLEGEPVAIFGAYNTGSTYYTWFAATDRFCELGKQATRFLISFLRQETKKRPDAELELVTATEHRDAPRWFKLLGFKEEERNGFFLRYKYDVQNQLTAI